MNEFLEQFLLESREYIEQATADLLALEKTPGDKERIDSAFRAFHTLKGGAGIVEFPAMADAVHAAEDALVAVRAGSAAITVRLISDCLACLDQVVQWLDEIERTDEIPPRAAAATKRVVARFAVPESGDAPVALDHPDRWLEQLLARRPALRSKARIAIRYAPERDCFFKEVDPCRVIAAVPGLLSLDFETIEPWPGLDAFDLFASNLVFMVLSDSSHDAVVAALGAATDRCEIRTLDAGHAKVDPALPPAAERLPRAAEALLQAQLELIDSIDSIGREGVAGRMASAGAVVAAVLRHLGRTDAAAAIEHTTAASLGAHDAAALRKAIAGVLDTTAPAAIAAAPAAARPEAVAKGHEVAVRSLRVDAARIDALVDLTGELTVAKNSIDHAIRLAQEGDAAAATMLGHRFAVLDRLVGELQRSVLGMRVLPLRHVFQRFPRMLREVSDELGKPVDLQIEGGDTDADKVIVEMLFEPLLHVLRNAIGHGIESAPVRAAQGKPATATIQLSAGRRSDHVIIEVADDGGGIDVARIREVAAERAMLSGDVLAALSDEEAINLIFEPGFSTASVVTGLSGRGVGLDAVRHTVNRFGGAVGVESRVGVGTTVRFTLPFSVMMTRVMVVGAGDQKFGIPLDAVVETLRVRRDAISMVGSAEAFVLRNRTVPLLSLADVLGLSAAAVDGVETTETTVVVTKVDGQLGALSVDRIGERMEVMLKPLDGLLAGTCGIAGSTLLGDGSVLLILDVGEIFQ